MLIDKDPAQGYLCLAGRLSFPFLAAGLILAEPARAGMVVWCKELYVTKEIWVRIGACTFT